MYAAAFVAPTFCRPWFAVSCWTGDKAEDAQKEKRKAERGKSWVATGERAALRSVAAHACVGNAWGSDFGEVVTRTVQGESEDA